MSPDQTNAIELLTIENETIRVTVAPALGGKIVSIYNKTLGKEFLWSNGHLPLAINSPGADYDSCFTGGIDELLPNDLPETIDSVSYPDHGELWTTQLSSESSETMIVVYGSLPLSGLFYSRTLTLDDDHPAIRLSYHIRNECSESRSFLWKLHAALKIAGGDKLVTDAAYGKVVDPEYSRFKKELEPFRWPDIEQTDASLIPEKDNTVDFFYLYDVGEPAMQLLTNNGEHLFRYEYDKEVFPYQWWFASYGGFLGHYTAILEPCTNMPMSVNEARKMSQSAVLAAGESLLTEVRIFAGEKKNYIP